jgi:hypothetical protein
MFNPLISFVYSFSRIRARNRLGVVEIISSAPMLTFCISFNKLYGSQQSCASSSFKFKLNIQFMKKKAFTFFILSLPMVAFAQFNEAIGTYKDQVGYSVQRTQVDPGFIAAGLDGLTVFGGKEASIVKVKPSGIPQWSNAYGGVGNDEFKSIREIYAHATLPIDGYAALGTTTSFNSSEDLYFVRTDQSGTPLYSFTFGRKEGTEKGHCLQYIKDFATGGYGYVMVGQTNSYSYYGYSTDILIVKTNEDGALTGAKVIGAQGEDVGYWVEQTKDGGFVVTGSTTTHPEGDNDIFVIRLDKDLNLLWQNIFKHCSTPLEDFGYGIVENPLDGSFTVTGITKSFGLANSEDAFLLNLRSNGTFNWMRTYGTKQIEQGLSVDLSSGGSEYIVSGLAVDEGGNKDAYVFKTDMTGNLIWSNVYGSAGLEAAAEITNNGFGGYIFTGVADSYYTINQDFYLVNLKSGGESEGCQNVFDQGWKSQWPCTSSNFQSVDVNDIRMVCTQYERTDYSVQLCEAGASVGRLAEPSPESADVLTIVPNPTSTSVQVLFEDAAVQKAGGSLAIFNRNGKIVHQQMVPASGEIRIPVENLPNDLYMVRFTTSDGKQHQKKFIKK